MAVSNIKADFSEKLCPCLDGIYGSIPFPRIFVLVCKRYRVR